MDWPWFLHLVLHSFTEYLSLSHSWHTFLVSTTDIFMLVDLPWSILLSVFCNHTRAFAFSNVKFFSLSNKSPVFLIMPFRSSTLNWFNIKSLLYFLMPGSSFAFAAFRSSSYKYTPTVLNLTQKENTFSSYLWKELKFHRCSPSKLLLVSFWRKRFFNSP